MTKALEAKKNLTDNIFVTRVQGRIKGDILFLLDKKRKLYNPLLSLAQ